MSESTETNLERFKKGMKTIASFLRRGLPFASGVFAALLAFILYNLVIVQPNQLSVDDVNASVASAMGSATPPPSYSAQVYEIIRPSLVLIETEEAHQDAESDFGLGSGVVVDSFGDILTSLHVIDGATRIKITFADGTESEAQVITEIPELDLAVIQALDSPPVRSQLLGGDSSAVTTC